MQLTEAERAKDQEIERALQEIGASGHDTSTVDNKIGFLLSIVKVSPEAAAADACAIIGRCATYL